ncbi:MAG: hypothetical protein F4X14_16325 [Caldilineaceae bacterium SB0661_bin_32]|uniref:Mandelate racemase/muconate lactonizing enzyme C-terminal domain-containing protein n=1 Tax=Caldilineaceae bacterium SB0661_bin_32 TaxID=2605255 RepID=A0A6B1DAW6_9CHLR|nr:hypothetical protein [Caldilineaceae bacterium SB0661_bin_32]
MKITDIKLHTLEHPTLTQVRQQLVQVPGLRRIQYKQIVISSDAPMQMQILDVETDEGITGRIAPVSISRNQLDILRTHAVGESPFARERLFQMLHKGTRWVYQEPGWFGEFDNCLWDIAGKAAGLPVYALTGRVRDRLPVYLTDHELTPQGYLDQIERGRTFGVNAYKLHTYRGGKADIPLLTDIRKEVGDDYDLLNDPVCSYDLREAIEVGRAMEALNYVWLEEPMHEQKMNQYQELCSTLTIPIIATERLCHDMDLSAQWLIQGATDRLRARTNHGLTQVLKLARFAELHGTNVELHGPGSLYGIGHAHAGCGIDNTDFFEFFGGCGPRDLRTEGEAWGLLSAPLIEDGHIAPPDGPGWGAVWDEDRVRSLTVATD